MEIANSLIIYIIKVSGALVHNIPIYRGTNRWKWWQSSFHIHHVLWIWPPATFHLFSDLDKILTKEKFSEIFKVIIAETEDNIEASGNSYMLNNKYEF